jgi:hypothetical protein
MGEAAGDVLALATPSEQVEATRMGRAEAGLSRWCVRYPWSTETFYGTAEQVMAHMRKRVGEQEAAEAREPPFGTGDTAWRASPSPFGRTGRTSSAGRWR